MSLSQQDHEIIQCFKNLGYIQTSTLTLSQMDQLLHKINNGKQFHPEISEQLWEHTKKVQGKVLLMDYIQTIIQAQNAVKYHIDKTKQYLKQTLDEKLKLGLSNDLISYLNDYKILTQPFGQASIYQKQIIIQ